MVLINNNWEQVKDLSDIVRIVKENIGDEFAREVERICGDYEFEISELKDEIDSLKDENAILLDKIQELKNER